MKHIRISFFTIMLIALGLVSCQEENIDQTGVDIIEETTEEVAVNPIIPQAAPTMGGLDMDCFQADYPFSMADQDGNVYSIGSEEDFNSLMSIESIEYLDFVYPLNVTYEDGSTDVINDIEELANVFASCLPDGWDDSFPAYIIGDETSCYELVYPLNLVDEQGVVTTVNSEDELVGAIAEAPQFFEFPLTLQHEDGTQISVGTIDELLNALVSCSGWDTSDTTIVDWDTGVEYVGCYTTTFPMNILTPDGTVVVVNDHMELCDLMLEGNFFGYAYPLTLVDMEGNALVVNSDQELNDAIAECPGFGGGPIDESFVILDILYLEQANYADCFTVNFPITILSPDGSTAMNNWEEYEGYFNSGNLLGAELPIFVTLSDGSVAPLESVDDLFGLFESCE